VAQALLEEIVNSRRVCPKLTILTAGRGHWRIILLSDAEHIRTPNEAQQTEHRYANIEQNETSAEHPQAEHEHARTAKSNTFKNRTPNKTPNTNKRFPNTEHCSGAALG